MWILKNKLGTVDAHNLNLNFKPDNTDSHNIILNNAHDLNDVILTLTAERLKFYTSLSTWPTYGKGCWKNENVYGELIDELH